MTLFETEWSFNRPNQLAKTSAPTWAFKRALTRSKSALWPISPFSAAALADGFAAMGRPFSPFSNTIAAVTELLSILPPSNIIPRRRHCCQRQPLCLS
jgi:hypothetical protein